MTVRPHLNAAALLLVSMILAQFALAEGWTRFRGPEGTGISDAKTVPAKFAEKDYNWSIALDGSGHSSPLVWKDHLYLTIIPDGKEGVRELRCLSTKDGSTLWTHEQTFDPYHNHKFNNSASTTPALDDRHVYFYSTSAERVLLEAVSHEGKRVWHREWKGFSMEHGQSSSPILVGDALIIANDQLEDGDGFIMGIDPANGKTLWEHPRTSGKAGYSTPGVAPAPRTKSRKQVVFVSMTHGLTGVDPDTGKVLWKHEPAFEFRSVGTPVYEDGVLFTTVGAGGGGKDSIALDLGANPEKPETLYRLQKDIPYVPTPIAHDGRIYLWQDSGILRCIEAKTGETVYEHRVGGNYFSSPVLVGDHLWGMSREGRIVVVKAGDKFEIVGEGDVGSGVNASPAVADGVMYIRTDTHLISLGGR